MKENQDILVTQKRIDQDDTISSWELLIQLCHELDITIMSKKDSIILTERAEIPPRMLLSLKILKDYTISCLKGIPEFLQRSNQFIYT